MLWRDPRIVKGPSSAWSLISTPFVLLAFVWLVAFNIQDQTWRWSVALIGAVVCFLSPGGLACIHWLFSPQYRKQHYNYRRGGPIPGYSPDAPWDSSQAEVGKTLKNKTDFYLSENTILGSHSEAFQNQLKEEMYESARAIYNAENPLKKCRERLAAYVVGFADWQVLCLKPEEKPQPGSEDRLRDSSYVTGELHHHIRDCVQYNADLADFVRRNKDAADDDLITWANARSCAFLYQMTCMNMIRVDVTDCDHATLQKGADWFVPFTKSMLIWKEDDYRRKIGLPSLLANELAWRHSTFLTYVLEGVHDPLAHWEAAHQLKHSYVS
jgi:hypothetical protein